MSGENRDKGAAGNYPALAPAFLPHAEQDTTPEQSRGPDGCSDITSLVHTPARAHELSSKHRNTATTSTELLAASQFKAQLEMRKWRENLQCV